MRLASFQIDGRELQRRRDRCRPLLPALSELPVESLSSCSACGSRQYFVLTPIDRYGLPLRAAMCMVCGLVFQVDRFTTDGFQEFYGGAYRDLVSAFKGKAEGDIPRLRAKQEIYGRSLLDAVKDRIGDSSSIQRIADVGGSTGVVAGIFSDHYGASATVVDPGARELGEADGELATVQATVEDWQPDGTYDLVLLCNTIEHLHDLAAGFAKLKSALGDDGWLVCDVADFMASCRLEGPPEVVAKVDHCFWLSLETASKVFGLLGFSVAGAAYGRVPQQVTFLLKPTAETPEVTRDPAVSGMLSELQTLRGEWLGLAQRSAGIMTASRLSSFARRLLGRGR